MADNDSIAEESSADVVGGPKEFTYEPVDDGVYPDDTIGADTQVSALDSDELEDIINCLKTYKTITKDEVEGRLNGGGAGGSQGGGTKEAS